MRLSFFVITRVVLSSTGFWTSRENGADLGTPLVTGQLLQPTPTQEDRQKEDVGSRNLINADGSLEMHPMAISLAINSRNKALNQTSKGFSKSCRSDKESADQIILTFHLATVVTCGVSEIVCI